MIKVLGGIAEWLHENGVKTNFDVTYEKWRLDSGLPVLGRMSPNRQYLGIYATNDKPAHLCWIDGVHLIVRNILVTQPAGLVEPIIIFRDAYVLLELADPGFLDVLFSKTR